MLQPSVINSKMNSKSPLRRKSKHVLKMERKTSPGMTWTILQSRIFKCLSNRRSLLKIKRNKNSWGFRKVWHRIKIDIVSLKKNLAMVMVKLRTSQSKMSKLILKNSMKRWRNSRRSKRLGEVNYSNSSRLISKMIKRAPISQILRKSSPQTRIQRSRINLMFKCSWLRKTRKSKSWPRWFTCMRLDRLRGSKASRNLHQSQYKKWW